MKAIGRVVGVERGFILARLPRARIGDGVRLDNGLTGEVCGFGGEGARISAYGATTGVASGSEISIDRRARYVDLGTCVFGRAIDAQGAPLDALGAPNGRSVLVGDATPLRRVAVTAPYWTGIRAIDSLLTIGAGSRIGIFGAPGTGKSTLLEMLMRDSAADATVVALIGERGREAQSWIARCDGRTTIVCSTSERSAAERVRAVRVAFAHARALCDCGLSVVVLLDSLARCATALRELFVANGEAVGRGGFPPSVFAELAWLVERCGATTSGSITLVATVLDDGDERDPISDAARSLLDGHVQLSLSLAQAGRFPAIDVCASTSRTMRAVVDAEHHEAAKTVRRAMALLAKTADARELGLASADAPLQRAIYCESDIERLLRQDPESSSDPAASRALLLQAARKLSEAA